MRRILAAILVIVLVAVVGAAAFFFWPEPAENVTAFANLPQGPALIARGEYLARAADCVACHTAPGGKQYAGGLPFKLPFGTIYAPNITPDKDTGIGNWTDADFVRALHRGVGRDGEMLYPAFPYASYALMSTDDALAIKAYLFSLPAVHAPTPATDLQFPYNQRYLMRAWRLLYVPAHPFQPDTGKPADWNRGYYLVEAMGHCGECHTPRTSLYGLDDSRKFAGTVTEGWKAYNITSDKQSGIGAWSDAQIASYLSQGYADGRGAASGSMAEAVEHSLRFLTPDDIHAMVAYLRTIPPQKTEEGPPVALDPPAVKVSTAYSPAPDEAHADTLGLQIFEGACASCHGWNGKGLEHPNAALLGSQTVNDPHATNLLQVVLHGASVTTQQGQAFMPPFGAAYSDTEIAAVANYVLAHFGDKHGAVTPADVAAARRF
jgi:mono/diheme cytochrome c family protein